MGAVYISGDDELEPTLACWPCGEILLAADAGIVDLDSVVSTLQAHAYACRKRELPTEYNCPTCRTPLVKIQGDRRLVCNRCTRTIAQAELGLRTGGHSDGSTSHP